MKREIEDVEREFWKYVELLGYPAGPDGVVYGSEEHEKLKDIQNLLKLDTMRFKGETIGWPAGSFYSRYLYQYPDVHWAFILASQGEGAMVSEVISYIWDGLSRIEIDGSYLKDKIEELKSWMEKGGVVTHKSVIEFIDDDSEDILDSVLSEYEHYFSDERKKWIMENLRRLGISEENIKLVEREFESVRAEAKKYIEELERYLREFLESVG